jgi:cyclic-di-GMP-binding protein
VRAWLATLPLADSAEAARQIYQSLYALNRMELEPAARLEIMELYTRPVATVAHGLHGHLSNPALPLSPKRRQLAEFIRDLYSEMAIGFKCCLLDMQRGSGRVRRLLDGGVIERAMYYLGGVLLRSYLVYIPTPAGVWREIHTLFRFADETGRLDEPVSAHGNEDGTSVRRCYLRILLMAAINPYQYPSGDQLLAHRFLGKWAGDAAVGPLPTDPKAGSCVVDLASDSPPMTRPAKILPEAEGGFRVLDTTALVRTVTTLGARLQSGVAVPQDELGMDCLNRVCISLLRSWGRAWASMARREHARIRRNGSVSVCRGLDAVHFFAGGLKALAAPVAETVSDDVPGGPPSLPPDQDSTAESERESGRTQWAREPSVPYRIDRWRVRDISPKGLNLVYLGEATSYVRIGDLVGVQRPGQFGTWSVGIVRWMKSPNAKALSIGVEVVSPKALAVTAARGRITGTPRPVDCTQGLLLPPMPAVRRPASLLVPRGWSREGAELELIEGDGTARVVRALKITERNNTCDQVVFAMAEG